MLPASVMPGLKRQIRIADPLVVHPPALRIAELPVSARRRLMLAVANTNHELGQSHRAIHLRSHRPTRVTRHLSPATALGRAWPCPSIRQRAPWCGRFRDPEVSRTAQRPTALLAKEVSLGRTSVQLDRGLSTSQASPEAARLQPPRTKTRCPGFASRRRARAESSHVSTSVLPPPPIVPLRIASTIRSQLLVASDFTDLPRARSSLKRSKASCATDEICSVVSRVLFIGSTVVRCKAGMTRSNRSADCPARSDRERAGHGLCRDRWSHTCLRSEVHHEGHIGRHAIQCCFISDVALQHGKRRSPLNRGEVPFLDRPVVEIIERIEPHYSIARMNETFREVRS